MTLPPEVLARIESESNERPFAERDGYEAGAIKEAERAAELVAFLERWKTYNIEAEEEDQNKYDSQMENVLSHYRGEAP